MDAKSKIIIIKKNKKGHGGAHGGSWKVAYADFVTAMMAFFLLMWLLNMTSEEKRIRLAMYFQTFSLFEHAGTSFLDKSSSIHQKGEGEAKAKQPFKGGIEMTSEDLRQKLKEAVAGKFQGMADKILIDVTDEGVRIQLIDDKGEFFAPGSAVLTERAKEVIKLIAENIRDFANMLVVEGHTDAVPFRSGSMTNWELSATRAAVARAELEKYGVEPARFQKVVGFADKMPLVKENPEDPKNRRISFIVTKYQIKKFIDIPPENVAVGAPPPKEQPKTPIIESPAPHEPAKNVGVIDSIKNPISNELNKK